jgi:tRNA nucleotidyltransferase/poly(A) polymerase
MQSLEDIRIKIYNAIKGTELENCCYFAGGCVRDNYLKRIRTDLDICVEKQDGDALLAQVLQEKNLIQKVVKYPRTGTLKTKIDGYSLELSPTQIRTEMDNGVVHKIFASLQEDACSRDFTINALMMAIHSGELLDFTNKGIKDLEARLIRACEPEGKSFLRDPNRILRAIRLAAELEIFNLEEETSSEIRKNSYFLERLNPSRISQELKKILSLKSFFKAQYLIQFFQLMSHLLTEFKDISLDEKTLNWLEHPELNQLISKLESMEGRFCFLYLPFYLKRIDNNPELIKNLEPLKSYHRYFSNQQNRHIDNLLYAIEIFLKEAYLKSELELSHLREAIHKVNEDFAELWILLQCVDNYKERISGYNSNLAKLAYQLKNEMDTNPFLLTGTEFMHEYQLVEGKEIGYYLQRALSLWYQNPRLSMSKIMELSIKEYQGK